MPKPIPGKLSYAHTGIGSTNHLTGELFKLLAGIPEIVQVPYRGMGPALTDVIGGQVPMAVAGFTGQVLEFHRSGRIRVLAVTSPKRLATAPELPTVAEAGLPGLTVTASLGLLAPSGTPTPVIEQIAQATRTALAEPTYQQSLIEGGLRTHPRFKSRKIPPVACRRRCTLGAGGQIARAEARLIVAQIYRFNINVRVGCAPCKGGAFQWVEAPPGNRSSRKQSEQSWR